jgi:DNA topoisomerase-2
MKIDIKVDNKSIQIQDNGLGIPNIKTEENTWMVYRAFCEYNTSSNYGEEKGQGQKGVNGIGVKLCTTLSKILIVENDDGKSKIKLKASENNLYHEIKQLKSSGKTGVRVYFEPDFNIFDIDEINEEHIQRMYEYTLIQALTYPDITFKFNNKVIKITPKKFMTLFEDGIIEEQEDYFIIVSKNEFDDFKQISYINGLETHLGGSHINYITDTIVSKIREKLQKKSMFKNIRPGDIKNKLMITVIAKNMRNVDWDGQTKASITSPISVMRDYFSKTDFEKFTNKILKNEELINNITEFFKIKAEMKQRAELKKLSKKRKIKSEKYLPATKRKKVLFLCEGASAVGGLMPSLGRDEYGYFELKGVPLNAYDATHQKFSSNKELSELFQVIQNEDYQYICTATDADADGSHIKGLLLGFFTKYLPELLEKQKFGELQTPVQPLLKIRNSKDGLMN